MRIRSRCGSRRAIYKAAAILNVQRACEAALDMGQHLIRRERLDVPQSSRDVFERLARVDLGEFLRYTEALLHQDGRDGGTIIPP